MRFRGHLIGGITTGIAVCGLAVFTGTVHLRSDRLSRWLVDQPLPLDNGIATLAGIFLITVTMSLFPDLDGASIPQRWFFRLVFGCLVAFLFLNRMDLFAAVALISLLPLLHRHRGWTHSWLTPIIIALAAALLIGYLRGQQPWLRHLSLSSLTQFIGDGWIYILACITGHYTHLLLDSR